MNKLYYSYEMCKEDTQKLVDISKSFKADAFLSIARGGLTLSHLIEIFNIPDLKSYKKVLIIDDIVDSGKTMIEVFKILNEKFPNTEFKLATLFYKKTALIKPDFYIKETDMWIEFFWEVDIQIKEER